MSGERIYAERRKSVEEALRAVKRGAKVFPGTACGIADLHGKTVREERAMAIIKIAHPRFRKPLPEEARRRSYVYPDPLLIHKAF